MTSATGRGLATAAAGLTLAALPIFLVGGLAVQIRAELGFTESQLGLAVTLAFSLAAITGPWGGRVADRIGPRASVAAGISLSVVALAGLALVASSYLQLLVFLGVAGLAFSLVDPGLALVVTSTVPPDRHGFAFGVKEASVPLATLLAGLAVPIIALEFGWRWATLIGLAPAAVLAFLLPGIALGRTSRRSPVPGRLENRNVIVMIALGTALGSAAASGVGVFLTESGVAMGFTESAAGILLAVASVAGVATRVGTGLVADRKGGPQVRLMAGMLAIGALAMLAGASGHLPLVVVGALGAFSGGWGWSGLLFLTLVRMAPSAAGRAAGIGLMGLATGNAIGPLGFGLIAQSAGFSYAWLVAAGFASLAAGVMFWAGRPSIHV